MSSRAEQVLTELRKAVAEIEQLAKQSVGAAEAAGDDAAQRLSAALAEARSRISDTEKSLQRELQRGAKAADSYVHENVWLSIGIAAAAAFVLGAMTTRRERD
jgi:ElaB/YqjD/DUF883 family membrane-anchored ribosome-binding protein